MIKKLNTFRKNERTGHSVFYVIFLIVCFLAVGAGFVCFRLRNGVQVKAPRDREYLSDAEVVFYRQDDERCRSIRWVLPAVW